VTDKELVEARWAEEWLNSVAGVAQGNFELQIIK
jgi:hypothetical protein